MQPSLRRAAFVLVAFALAVLTACGDPEPDQRKAFTEFLQTRILDKPGLRVPQPNPDQTKVFGPYADHYAIITKFHTGMNESVSPKLSAAMAAGSIRSIGDLTTRRADIQTAKATLSQMSDALGANLAEADAGHGRLAQPPDLKTVYDKAYDRLVTSAAATFREVVPAADAAFSKALNLADYIEQHKAQIKISGAMLQVSDRKIQDELNAKLQSLQGDQKAVQEAQAKLQTMIHGAK